MIRILLEGEIGWSLTSEYVEYYLREAAGADIEVVLASPGGSTSEGVKIFDKLTQYKKDYPQAQMIAHVLEASSMASYLLSNPAFDLRTGQEISIGMIHNPQGFVHGDYNDLTEAADFFKRMTNMFAKGYSRLLQTSENKIKSMMDAETWYIGGEELKAAGLIDEIITTQSEKNISEMQLCCESNFQAVMSKIKSYGLSKAEISETIKMISKYENFNPGKSYKTEQNQNLKMNTNRPAQGKSKTEDSFMDKDKLKKECPELYAEMIAEGIRQGKEQEKARVSELIEMSAKPEFNIPDFQARIMEGISQGENKSEVVLSLTAMLAGNTNMAAAHESAKIPSIVPGENNTPSGEVQMKSNESKF